MTRVWRTSPAAALLPLVLLALLIGVFLTLRPLDRLSSGAPPLEDLVVERVALGPAGITAWVRAGGSEPLRLAQVQVDGAYWTFTQTLPGPLARLQAARIEIPYPWVAGETHHLVFLTATGVAFEHTIDVALSTPELSAAGFLAYGAVGFLVGVVPVTLGLMFFPALQGMGRRGLAFVLALTIGLLVFLLIDTLEEGLEVAGAAASPFQASALVWLAALVSFLALFVVGRRRGGAPEGLTLAAFIALGIGLHNLGEGLVIGTSFATGEVALASFLVVGFTLHNVTEGIGIAAPLTKERPGLLTFAGLAALAGLPAVFGTWGGAFAFSPHLAALCFGIGAGAILQVVVEVGAYLSRTAGRAGETWLSGTSLLGFVAGLAVMYATALLVRF
jgi:zinc transporter, ZIP family